MTVSPTAAATILRKAFDTPDAASLLDNLRGGARVAVASGLIGPARALTIAVTQRVLGRPVLVIAPDLAGLEALRRDVAFFVDALGGEGASADSVLALPDSEADPYDGMSPHAEILEERSHALLHLARGTVPIVLATMRGLLRRTVPPERLIDLAIELALESDYRLESIVETLLAAGYVREDPVGAIGEFSLRGGILDVFPPGRETPVRVEFFGDTADSIRAFDPETQRSVERLRDLLIPPMREMPDRRKALIAWSDAAPGRWSAVRFNADLKPKIAASERGESFPGWEYLLPLVDPLEGSAVDYLASNTLVIVDEPVDVERHAAKFLDRLSSRYAEAAETGEVALEPETIYLSAGELRDRLDGFQRLDLRVLGSAAAHVDGEIEADGVKAPVFAFPLPLDAPESRIASQSALRYHGRIPELADELSRAAAAGSPRLLVMPSIGVAERVVDVLREYEVPVRLAPNFEGDAAAGPVVGVGRLGTGFRLPAANLTVLVESDLFASVERPSEQRRAAKRSRPALGAFLSDFRDLKHGDFVVHVDHGIGRFQGLFQLPTGDGRNETREFMLLTYADAAKLYVPVERLDLVQKYSAGEGHEPKIDRLGGVAWEKTKAKTSRAMRDMAEELLKLYAERRLVGGHAYQSDGPWQREFEEAFEYQLTVDQETAIRDVKTDMENNVPMDRLLCGDVGYGKTEVAMRAMFKAVMEGKQVAVLAPTTVLVFQHFTTLRQRFAAFPVKIEMLSRFRSAKELKATVGAVERGEVDIVVGTHRLLSKDVAFRDLGLVVVDEEQRFGVAHKERLKQLRKRVDVLTMSATPIPRTLNMSLAGLRDMSVIETPPRDRLAIQTVVVPFSEHVVRSAIEQELSRGGQVFFVHNRVETIFTIAELIARIVPSARLAVGHGQMGEKMLEDVMFQFVHHEADVLVSTTIIENGIDIPLANTMIINRADAFGLSQLYQLRGRVGRSNRQAYAYLLIPSEGELTTIARKRLTAIREFADLGAGFRVAALDLELRGAGNMLGGQQSGFISAVGFDMYCQMLDRAVRELRGEKIEDDAPTTVVNLGIDVRIPDEFIADVNQRLRTYKRISTAETDAKLDDVRAELSDRYGPIPASVDNLFGYARVRNRATALGIAAIDLDRARVSLKLDERTRIAPERLLEFIDESAGDAVFTPGGMLRVTLSQMPTDDRAAVAVVDTLLRRFETED